MSSRFEANAVAGGKFWLVRILSIVAVVGGLYAFQVVLVPHLGIYDVRLIVLSLLFATLAVSLNLINGITGQFSIGHAGFYLIGAMLAGKLSLTFYQNQQLQGPIWLLLMVLAGGAAAALAGYIVGLPSLRLKGDYLAIVTLGFGEIVRVFVINQDGRATSIAGLDLGGPTGLQSVPKLYEVAYIALLLIVTIACARNLLKTGHGLAFLSVREDELAAEATGVNTTKLKVTAFVLGAAIAGMAGALFGHYNSSVSPDDFKMDVSFILVAMVVIGGTGSITGAAVAGIGLKLLEEALRELESVPAIGLFASVLALIVVLLLYRWVRKSESSSPDGPARPVLSVIGIIACLATLYGSWLLWKSDMSVVLRVVGAVALVAAVLALALTRQRIQALPRYGMLALCAAAVYGLSIPFNALLGSIGAVQRTLGSTTYTPGDLRWAFFAIALVVVMLVRPQGLFGHHEFSWDWVKSLFGKKHKETAVAA